MNKVFLILTVLSSATISIAAGLKDTSVGCRVLGDVPGSKVFGDVNKNVIFETGRTFNLKDKKTIKVEFKTLDGQSIPFKLSIEKLELGPNQFNQNKSVGAAYSFNNPFEKDARFSRNDKTAETKLVGIGFAHENAITGHLTSMMDYMKSRPNQSTITPYMMVGLTNSNSVTKELVAPNGDIITSLLVVCTTAHIDE